MKAKLLTRQRLKEVVRYDPATGDFTWLISPRWGINPGMPAGEKARGVIQIDGKPYSKVRLRELYLNGILPPPEAVARKLSEVDQAIHALATALASHPFKRVTAVNAVLAKALKEDLAEIAETIVLLNICSTAPLTPLTPEELEIEAEDQRIAETLADYQYPILTAHILAEFADVDYSSRSNLTWPAIIRGAGWVKLGTTLLTKHGQVAVYCRATEAGEWALKNAVELRAGLPDGMYAGYQAPPVLDTAPPTAV